MHDKYPLGVISGKQFKNCSQLVPQNMLFEKNYLLLSRLTMVSLEASK